MKKIRYAVVGAGWISQIAFMPSIAQTGNSEMTAIVSGNPANARKLAEFYGIGQVYPYQRYDELLKSGLVDAVYIALPNSLHADYAIRAANAGIHALVEKPLAVTVAECEAMIAAAERNGVQLMTAYRLHTEPGTLEAIDMVRRGEIGEPRIFSSVFSFPVGAGNHRLKAEHWGGPLQDIGVYCINAVRHLFQAEPTEVIAAAASAPGDQRFAEVEEMVSATLRFPGDRLAHFTASFGADDLDQYRVIGTKGQIEVSPGFKFDRAMKIRLTSGGGTEEKSFPQYDHFSGQAHYFSDCILKGIRPEPDGGDGLADVAIMRAIEEAARTGRSQKISLPPRPSHPVKEMGRAFPMAEKRLML
ncbi:Gfo/Idh/MocA family protein [Aestuariivirga sp.]|uniref:Gfo/Idh/MocA family protein n=1 Tax=Aestuariivirga sp. TaxID=2650926 RepID=UPI00391BADC2